MEIINVYSLGVLQGSISKYLSSARNGGTRQVVHTCLLLHFYCHCCCEAQHTLFVLVQVLLFPRGTGSHSAVTTAALDAVCLGLIHSEHRHLPGEADPLHLSGQGTLCAIDPRPDESFQFSFKFSWAALHHDQLQMPWQLTGAVSCFPCTWPGEQVPVVEAEMRSTNTS